LHLGWGEAEDGAAGAGEGFGARAVQLTELVPVLKHGPQGNAIAAGLPERVFDRAEMAELRRLIEHEQHRHAAWLRSLAAGN
jgi:hypothetical protein